MKERRFFQYLAGPKAGEILEFDGVDEDDGEIFVCFKEGSRCNEDLIMKREDRSWKNELMAEIDPNNPWTIEKEWVGRQEEKWDTNADGARVCVIPFIEGRQKIVPRPPKKISSFAPISSTPDIPPAIDPTKEEEREEKKEEKSLEDLDPVWIMCHKAKKFDSEIGMSLDMGLPSGALYNLIKENFEDGEEKFLNYIISSFDSKDGIDKIKRELKNSLRTYYESMGKGEEEG